jgi:hypothetical protein
MNKLSAMVAVLALNAGTAFAQTPVAPTEQPSAAARVENWTTEQ